MNSLTFQPAFDVFHTEFRYLRLRRIMGSDFNWHYDRLRIIDFYLLFFFRLSDVRLLPKHKDVKALAKSAPRPAYESQPDARLIFDRMAPIQRAAAETLVAKGYFNVDAFRSNIMVETEQVEPDPLSLRIDELNGMQAERMKALSILAMEYELLGDKGIKARTGLLEYRYDAI